MASVWPAKNNYATGDVLTAANMNGVGDDLNDVYNFSGYAAGKNKIINGDFGIWQRGTSITPASGFGYGPDRWRTYSFGASTSTISQQSFTAGTAPVAGYEGTYFCRIASTNTNTYLSQPIEDVRIFAGQTVTVSFWAKSASNQTLASVKFDQNFGSGGSGTVTTSGTAPAITTSWARYSVTIAVPSISGKTIGTGSYLDLVISGAINNNLDIWGVQVEAGSTASPFQTATGTKPLEEAACQRYYQRYSQTALTAQLVANASALSTTAIDFAFPPQVSFRTKPGSLETVNVGVYQFSNGTTYSNGTWSIPNDYGNPNIPLLRYTHGSAVFTANNVCGLVSTSGSNAGYIGLSAEL